MSKENDQNINVFVRIKPIDKTKISEKCATTAVKMISDKEIMVCERSQDRFSKNFTFDRVFDTMSTQIDVYKTVMSPLLKEMIAGYNCTVFAYGQTNTGKTYTMEGDYLNDLNLHWQSDTSAGMIPRCLSHLFDELLSRENYVVKINHLELYNEELFDLLSNDNDTSTSKLVLYEDARKGALTIQGLQEVIVHNKYEAYEILKRNSERRQTATTLLNISSSRSHTVFSIIVQVREKRDGNELLKTAKLNLVDLAGTENINKSGAVDERARETKNINKSLLALGRVITALVNKTAHIPYRESKLTRLLRESLGGQTKTSIIATVSSASSNIEETLSTLEYAHRARNITNHPKINQTLCNRRLLMECTREIECLRRDLLATRTKNGIFLPQNDYDDMQMAIMHQGKKIQELNNVHKMLQDEDKSLEERICNLRSQYNTQADVLTETIRELYDVKNSLKLKNKYVKQAEDDKNKQKYLVEKHVATIQILYAETRSLLNAINEISEHAQKLHDKLYCEKQIEEKNEKLARQTRSDLVKRYMDLENLLLTYKRNNNIIFQITRDEIETQIVKKIKDMEAKICSMINYLVQQHFVKSKNSKDSINASYTCYQQMLNSYMQDTSCTTKKKIQCFTDLNLDVISIIFDLLRYNEIFVQNLQILKTNVLLKLENMSNYAIFAFEAICRARFKECIHFLESLNKIREHINCIVRNKKQSRENCEQLGKEMENLLCKFSITNKEKNYFEIIDVSQQIDKLCAAMYDCTQIYDADISQIKSDIDHHFSQMCMMSKIVIEKGNILVDDFQKRLNSTCTILERYNDNVRSNNLEQIEKKMAEEKVKKFNSINDICLTQRVKNLSSDYAPFVKQISDSCKKINNQLTIHNAETHNCTNNIIEKIQASQRQIDQFLTEDFDRYVPTGSTPPRKKFSYPRKFAEFATTSPSLSRPTLNKSLTDFETSKSP